MNCNTLHTKLIFFLDGELPLNEMEEVMNHLADCSNCAVFASDMSKTLGVLQSDKIQQINPFFYTRVKARLESQNAETTASRKNQVLVRILQPAFFSMLLIAGIYAGIKIGHPSRISTDTPIYAETEIIPYLNEMETETIENFLME